jgi:hypothetical protein
MGGVITIKLNNHNGVNVDDSSREKEGKKRIKKCNLFVLNGIWMRRN